MAGLLSSNNEREVDNATPVIGEQPPKTSRTPNIGEIAERLVKIGNIDETVLEIQRRIVLCQIRKEIGSRHVSIGAITFAPAWIINEAVDCELENNWKEANAEVDHDELPRDCKLIGSHLVFKIKNDEKNNLTPK